jgi:hypothetical protein
MKMRRGVLSVAISLALFLGADTSFAITAGRLPGETITNAKGTTLQYNVCNNIYAIERRLAPNCHSVRVIGTVIVGQPKRLNFGRFMQWDERWTIDRCGNKAVYLIHFDFHGSVGNFKITPPPR